MPTELILDIMDQARAMRFSGGITFNCYSEPLLDDRNIMLAHQARERGMQPYLHTNGDLLRINEALCRQVMDVYEYVVVGIYDYETDQEMETSKQYWRERLPSADLRFSTIGTAGKGLATSMAIPRALVPTDERIPVPDLKFINGPCNRPLIRMIIRYDGEMCNCCEDIHGHFKLGNIYQNSLEELWFSDHHLTLIRDLLSGNRNKYELCANCPQSPTGPPPDVTKRIRMSPRRYTVKNKE
jgi:radical SAM protein with 4Fe4S-binding SPASM domain